MAVSLVIMAAGMGSRYGGLKQIDPIGPNGQILLDYSIYDAHRAGFDRVVFIIRPELHEALKTPSAKRRAASCRWTTLIKRSTICRTV